LIRISCGFLGKRTDAPSLPENLCVNTYAVPRPARHRSRDRSCRDRLGISKARYVHAA
jgi:hypothetical protein